MDILKKQLGVILAYLILFVLLVSAECAAENKTLLFVGNDSYPPISYQEGGQPKGLAIDIVRALGQRMGRQIDIRLMEWKVAQEMVAQGKADALCQLSITEPRKKIYDFSDQAHDLRFSIFVRTGKQGINDLSDLRGLQVAVWTASVQHQYAMADSQIKLTLIANDLQGFQLLKDGKVDAVLADLWTGSYVLAEKMITGIQTSGEPFAHLASALAVKKGNTELLAAINDGLRSLQADGTIERINEKWSPKEVIFQTREQAVRKTYSVIIGTLGLVLVLGAFWLITLRREISERRRTEEKLREITRRLQLATSSAKAGVWDWNLQKKEMIWDDRMLELYGLTHENFPGGVEAWKQGLHSDDSSRVIEEFQSALRGERNFDTEFRILRPDGKVVHIKANGIVLRDKNGKPFQMIGLNIDITERKKAEIALLESEERYESLLEQASDGIFILDTKGNIQLVNKSFARMHGYTMEEMRNLGLDRLDTKGSAPVADRIRRIMNGETLYFEVDHYHKDGHTFPLGVTANLVKFGNERLIIAVHRDLSERKQAENEKQRLEIQLQQAQKMEAIGTLAGGIAHDFNNILAIINGYTEMAMNEDSKEIRQQDLQETLKGAERAKNLVKQILTFSRQDDHEKKPLDIKILLKEAIKFLRASIPATVEINQQITDEDCKIIADPTQMHQVIMNLCANASHAMKETGGTLKIELANIELAKDEIPNHPELQSGHYVKLTFSDTGHGIDPALIQRIFDPFFTTKSVDEGTGLGLSVVYGIVKSHGGVTIVYSEQGKGAAFSVYLPRIIQTAATKADTDKPIIGGTERILFVDDESALVDLGTRMLTSLGYDVTSVLSSAEALNKFHAKPESFDLVITDMTLPKMTGIDLSREMLKIRSDIPIILCSGIKEPKTEAQVKSLGIKAYLAKPLTRRELSLVVRKTLEGDKKPHS